MDNNMNNAINFTEDDFDELEEELDELEEDEESEEKDDIDEDALNANLNVNENVIEFRRNQDIMTCTICQGRFVSRIRKMAAMYPDEVKIVAENDDGSIVAKIPVRALHLHLTKKREYTDEKRKEMQERMAKARAKSSRFNRGSKKE